MNQQSFIYRFLLSPQFRIWRFSFLVVFFSIASLNQALVSYKHIMPIGDKIYWIIAVTILIYIAAVYLLFNKCLKYLLLGKYAVFIVFIILFATVFTMVPNVVYFLYLDNFNLCSASIVIDNLSAFTIYILCISGVAIPVFLRSWIISNQHLKELKIKQKSSQIEQFKEQINPASFFKILQRGGATVKSEPDKVSAMLMKLGQLLRYQLYDCNRPQVLLSAEISFLRNFLELEKLYSSKLSYTIVVAENINGIFIPPSILLPYVQAAINTLDTAEALHSIDIVVNDGEKNICVMLKISGIENIIMLQKELLKVRDRLNTLYRDHYTLNIMNNQSANETEVILQLDKE